MSVTAKWSANKRKPQLQFWYQNDYSLRAGKLVLSYPHFEVSGYPCWSVEGDSWVWHNFTAATRAWRNITPFLSWPSIDHGQPCSTDLVSWPILTYKFLLYFFFHFVCILVTVLMHACTEISSEQKLFVGMDLVSERKWMCLRFNGIVLSVLVYSSPIQVTNL